MTKQIKTKQLISVVLSLATFSHANAENQKNQIFDIEIGSKITTIPKCKQSTNRFTSDSTCRISAISTGDSLLTTHVAVNYRKMPSWGKYAMVTVSANKRSKAITGIHVDGEVESKREFEYISESISKRFGNYSIPLGKFQTKEWKTEDIQIALQTGPNREYRLNIESTESANKHQMEIKKENQKDLARPKSI